MFSLARRADAYLEAIEGSPRLDPAATKLAKFLKPLFRTGLTKDLASGTPLGHPLHPALVAVPLGSFLATSFLDAVGGPAAHASSRRLLALGLVSSLPAGGAGASDWLDTEGAERRVGFVHASLNLTALGLQAISWVLRSRGRHTAGVVTSAAGSTVLALGGWAGGHLTYAMGVGVDTTAFQQFPQEWTDACAESDVPDGAAIAVEVAAIPVLITRQDGQVRALADRCTHRGAPLHEGELRDGCVICPWHGSRFELTDGSVQQGPATRPQPVFAVRTVAGRVQLRRSDEARSLRVNPTGV